MSSKQINFQPIDYEKVEYGKPYYLMFQNGDIIRASLIRDHVVDGDDIWQDQWVAVEGSPYPECWSNGACWDFNEDGEPSMLPKLIAEIQ